MINKGGRAKKAILTHRWNRMAPQPKSKVRTQKPSERKEAREAKVADMKAKAKELKEQRKAEKKKMGNKVPASAKFDKKFTGGGKGRKTYGK